MNISDTVFIKTNLAREKNPVSNEGLEQVYRETIDRNTLVMESLEEVETEPN